MSHATATRVGHTGETFEIATAMQVDPPFATARSNQGNVPHYTDLIEFIPAL